MDVRRFDEPMEGEMFDDDATEDFEPDAPAGNGTRARLIDDARGRAQDVAAEARDRGLDVAGKAQGWVRDRSSAVRRASAMR